MPASLYEKAVQCEEAFAGQTLNLVEDFDGGSKLPLNVPYLVLLTDTLRTVSSHNSLEAVKGTRLQVHVEAPSLESCQLMIRHNAVIVHVTDLEDAVEGFLAQIGQVLGKAEI